MTVVPQYSLFRAAAVLLVVLALSLVPFSLARAVMVDGLYRVTVPVAGDSPEQLATAYRVGLEQVLIRVSGTRDVAVQEGVPAILDQAESLLDNWQLQPDPSGESELDMEFSALAVNRALAEAGARVWGVNRPQTLAWIAVQDQGDRGLLVDTGERGGEGWSPLILRLAGERGLPLALPPAERAGERRLLSEIWGQFMEPVQEASSGIDHDLLAAVRISRRDGGWQASWVFRGQGLDQSQSVSAGSREALGRAMVDSWVEELAARYGVTGAAIDATPYVRLALEGVETASDYAAVKRSLASLNPVQAVGAVEVTRQRVVFRVEHSGTVEQLRQNIALDGRFQQTSPAPVEPPEGDVPADAGQGSASPAPTLYFRWRGQVIAPAGEGA